jgi:hypothetical protein
MVGEQRDTKKVIFLASWDPSKGLGESSKFEPKHNQVGDNFSTTNLGGQVET